MCRTRRSIVDESHRRHVLGPAEPGGGVCTRDELRDFTLLLRCQSITEEALPGECVNGRSTNTKAINLLSERRDVLGDNALGYRECDERANVIHLISMFHRMAQRTPPLVPRMRGYEVSVFAEMSRLAVELGCVNLGQGFPDTDGPADLMAIAEASIAAGVGNQYPPGNGMPDLREAIADHQQRFYGLTVDPMTEVTVTTGASEALAATILGLIDRDDEVLMLEPYFDIYAAQVAMAGGVRVAVPLGGPDLRPDIDRLRDAVTDRTRAILLNSPHNPTGVVLTLEELQAVADLAIERDLIVISDEAYEHLWFDGHPHVPISTLPGMRERTVTIGSGGKSFSFTGWKIGWASGPAPLMEAVRTVRQHLSYVSGGPFQPAIAAGLRLPDSYFEHFRHDLQGKRDHLGAGLAGLGMRVLDTQGTYFITTDITGMGYDDGLAFCRDLPHRAGVVAIPHQVMCDNVETGAPYVRWAFCKQPQVLDSAIERLTAAFA
jgi:N-succinyldiaminopimelate aminotransferase